MRLVMLSDFETQGGAAVAASRLADEFARTARVTRLVLHPDGEVHPWRTVALRREPPVAAWPIRVARRLLRALASTATTTRQGASKRTVAAHPMFAERQLRKQLSRLRPDVINVHNLHGGAPWGWSPRLAEICGQFAPVVWTLHDMWSFTGRCAYAYDCRRFETGCDAQCPTSGEHPALPPERIPQAWRERRQGLERSRNLVAVTPSRWLAAVARRGLWRDHRVETIPYGVPGAVYQPHDRRLARRCLGLPTLDGSPADPVVLVAAHDLGERRKGAYLLGEALPLLRGPFTLITMGKGELPFHNARLRIHSLGYVADEPTRALAYSAADLIIHPAPVDNFPNVCLEALACGTPVVAFPVGGVPEIVREGRTGWLASEASPASLADAVNRALQVLASGANLPGCDLRQSCRHFALAHFSSKAQAARYEALFRDMLHKKMAKGS